MIRKKFKKTRIRTLKQIRNNSLNKVPNLNLLIKFKMKTFKMKNFLNSNIYPKIKKLQIFPQSKMLKLWNQRNLILHLILKNQIKEILNKTIKNYNKI